MEVALAILAGLFIALVISWMLNDSKFDEKNHPDDDETEE